MSTPGDWIGCAVELSLKDGRQYHGVRLFAVDTADGWLEVDLGGRIERFLLREVATITLWPVSASPPDIAAMLAR